MGTKVSVIMPAWNAERFIEEAMRSVLGQDPRVEEVVIVDDGSSDRTFDVVLGLAAIDTRVRVFRQENQGVAGASNAALRHVQGDFIAVADNDDIQLPGRIAASLAAFEEDAGLDVWSGAIESWDGSDLPGVVHRLPASNLEIRAGMVFESQVFHQSACYRSSLLPANRAFYDPTFTMAGDYDLWSRMLSKARFRNGNSVTTRYRRHPGQATTMAARDGRSLRERRRVWSRMLEDWFGIIPCEDELIAHELAATWRATMTAEESIRLSNWLHRLRQVNHQMRRLDRCFFNRELARRHFWACRQASWSGARAVRHFFRSPLGWIPGIPLRSKAGFLARALRRG